jgi:predicted O-methyltransferase YrrM
MEINMSFKTLNFTPELYTYYQQYGYNEPTILQELHEFTTKSFNVNMQISPEQGQLLALLIRVMNAKKVLEIGTFMGYSSLAMALALPEDGKILTCDINENTTAIAKTFWEKAGVAHQIESRLGPATETLKNLISHQTYPFDFAFIDADKCNYDFYYESCLTLLRQGGLIAIDNVFWKGRVADDNEQEKQTICIRELNRKIKNDKRVSFCIVPIGDGMTLVRKV